MCRLSRSHASGGDVVVTGSSYANNGGYAAATICYNNLGEVAWLDRYDAMLPYPYGDFAIGVTLDASENVIVVGSTRDADFRQEVRVLKYDHSGSRTWVAAYVWDGQYSSAPRDFLVDDLGSVFITGYNRTNEMEVGIFLLWLNADGSVASDRIYDAACLYPSLRLSLGGAYVSGKADGECILLRYRTLTGCCSGSVGNANGYGGEIPTIGDVSMLIDNLFISGIPLPCLEEADINQSGGLYPTCDDITIGDISILIDYLFITGPPLGLAECL